MAVQALRYSLWVDRAPGELLGASDSRPRQSRARDHHAAIYAAVRDPRALLLGKTSEGDAALLADDDANAPGKQALLDALDDLAHFGGTLLDRLPHAAR